MAGSSDQGMTWLYDENTAKPKDEDFLLGKAVDANYEKGTLGQINAVEYGEILFYLSTYSTLPNKRRPYAYLSLTIFPCLRSYSGAYAY